MTLETWFWLSKPNCVQPRHPPNRIDQPTRENEIMSITKRYYWKELTQEGLLKEPPICGPYYDEKYLNAPCGFESEDFAIAAFESFFKEFPYSENSLILVCEFTIDG